MPNGIEARFFTECDSTNRAANNLALSKYSAPVWFVAGQQTNGRGRQDRKWASPIGNVYASLLFRPRLKVQHAGALPFITALAARSTFVDLGMEEAAVKCKWPNDILLNDKKACGILIESSASSDGYLDHVIIGIGMNLLHSPDDAAYGATSIYEETVHKPSVKQAVSILAKQVQTRIDAWKVDDFAPIKEEWTKHAWGLDKMRQIRTVKETFEATLLGLDDQGGLKVRLENGEERVIYTADVFPHLAGE